MPEQEQELVLARVPEQVPEPELEQELAPVLARVQVLEPEQELVQARVPEPGQERELAPASDGALVLALGRGLALGQVELLVKAQPASVGVQALLARPAIAMLIKVKVKVWQWL